MKKKTVFIAVLLLVFLVFIIVFFKPLSLSSAIKDNNQIEIVLIEIKFRDGKPYTDPIHYQNITEEQKIRILDLLENYPYRRTIGTRFSDEDMGIKTLAIYVYSGDTVISKFAVSSNGRVIVNKRDYSMKNAEQLVEKIIEIIK